MTNDNDTNTAGSGTEVADSSGEDHVVSDPAAVPLRRWKSVAAMRRSKLYKQHIAPLLTPEGQAKLAEEIAERIYQTHYAKDVSKRVALKEDPQAVVIPLPRPVVKMPRVDARLQDEARKFWTARLSLAQAARLQAHQDLSTLENEINTCQRMLNQLRTTPTPNGHNPEAAA